MMFGSSTIGSRATHILPYTTSKVFLDSFGDRARDARPTDLVELRFIKELDGGLSQAL